MTTPVTAVAGAVSSVAALLTEALDRPDDVTRAAAALRIGKRRAASLGVLARRRTGPAARATHEGIVAACDDALARLGG